MIEEELLALVEQYQSRFGHRVPSWAGKKGTAEMIVIAIANGEPVVRWRDYRPNPNNFFALANTLRREIASAAIHSNAKNSRIPTTL